MIRGLAVVLLIILVAEIGMIARHWVADAPVRQGIRVAARAERHLGAGPLSPRRYRLDYERVDARLRAIAARKDMVGLGIAVIEDGQLAFIKTYGETRAGSGEKATPQTVWRWASVSKGVAATMEAVLDAQGRLKLDDPISKWSPSLKLPKDNQNVATLADALSHRLGVVKNAYDDRLEANEDPAAIRSMYGGLFPMCPPGTCWAYQNVGFDVAREAVEKASGLSYDQAARKLIFGPLGMTSASTTREGLVNAASWARPHLGRHEIPVQDAYYRVASAGGVNSSIVDLGIWMRAQMGGAPNLLPPGLLWELHVPRVLTPRHGLPPYDLALSNNAYGLAFRTADYAGHHLVWHRGAVRGTRSEMMFDPVSRFGVAMLWNSSSVKPTGFPIELLDQFYGRPFHDWVEVGRP
ncbi:serine hydrolase domain-containing protein [Sphingomonas nostoxanthinifaciens]|uniref:serine hydrolase domain-containing protein n=1 Tax=Sphingomonas nostoxanthinifaciens TaxID=2872652 RepID=UPI001CC1E84F|nr:serine hydrolase domain-containing protein [Sphingomonas nostoxanthinifaciens]UAK23339.1 beta-lactamase family protein [Sphingomonas nostoxanthinifaciens]